MGSPPKLIVSSEEQFLILILYNLSILVFGPFCIDYCVRCEVKVQLLYFACGVQVSQHHFLKIIVFALNGLGTIIRNQFTINTWFYCWTKRQLKAFSYQSI